MKLSSQTSRSGSGFFQDIDSVSFFKREERLNKTGRRFCYEENREKIRRKNEDILAVSNSIICEDLR